MFRSTQLILFAITAITFSTDLLAQEAADDVSAPLVTKFYDISLLNAPQQHFPFDDGMENRRVDFQPIGGGAGCGGGTGYFSLPTTLSQFGGGGQHNGLGGIGGTDISFSPSPSVSLKDQLAELGEPLSSLIVEFVATDFWEDNGSGKGRITDIGNTLIVRQTEPVHQQVAEFLRSLSAAVNGTGTFQVEAWWVPAIDGNTSEVKSLLSGKLEEAVVLERLSAIAENEGGYHGTLLCRDRITAHMASGRKVPIIAGSTPVVGTGSPGYSPQVQTLHLGLMLEARVTSVPDFLSTTVDKKNAQQVELSFQSMVTSPDAQIQERATFEKVDRYVLGEHSNSGACRLRLGTPTLLGSLTQLSKQEEQTSEVPPVLQLVVRVTRTEE